MAATLLVHGHFCNSDPKVSSKQLQRPKVNQSPQLVTKPRISKPARFRRNTPRTSKTSVKPQNLTLTRALSAFVESRSMENALYLFQQMNCPDSYVWNVMIRGFTNNGLLQEALDFYYRMVFEGVCTDNFTYPFVIKACAGLLSLVEGEKLHAKLFKLGLNLDVYVCNSLISMYMKLGCVEDAQKVFEEMPLRDLVSWNSMISGYKMLGDGSGSLMYFREMLDSGIRPDKFSLISSLGASSLEFSLQSGKEIHGQAIRNGLETDNMIQTSLIDMYSKCGKMGYAERIFNGILSRNIVAWNALIAGYCLNGHILDAFSCLKSMLDDDKELNPDTITLINFLPACAQIGVLSMGKAVHGYAIRKGFLPHVVLETALIDMYGQCGEFSLAESIFFKMMEKNLVSWNAMVAAYVQNGQNKQALALFEDLWNKLLKPDATTIATIVPACAELASLNECMQIHAYVIKLGFNLNTIISNSIVYMYAKCGDLQTAVKLFDDILFKDVISWNTIIMAHAIHGFGRISIQLFLEMREKGIQPNGSTFVSLLLSCSISGLVNEGWAYFNSMKRDYGIDPGIEHYGCMLDLLGRVGDLDDAKSFIEEMPLVPTARIWGSLLAASMNNNDIVVAELAAKHILQLEHNNTGFNLLIIITTIIPFILLFFVGLVPPPPDAENFPNSFRDKVAEPSDTTTLTTATTAAKLLDLKLRRRKSIGTSGGKTGGVVMRMNLVAKSEWNLVVAIFDDGF
ncbi:pentatricopeptide repeat-containing protein At4g35130, chloroplastic-like [Carica papaya]|uniref:pentatricopeptide repeat-containing protein At4g35130, chloroplastic-like n=1 Tax=Carica papaya TaxID=3649 RepID=UPI000B8C6E04|nr:pentatricopeptide repeat-containing protein At4g35130, chloroplastic-like [Carica papaya]